MRRAVLVLVLMGLLLAVIVALRPKGPGMGGIDEPAPGAVTGAASAPPASTPAGRGAAETAALEHARDVLAAIEARQGQPLAGYVGGRMFHNREGRLPAGRYREYDVHPRTPGRDRGPERLIIDQATGRAYYSADHYRTFIPLN